MCSYVRYHFKALRKFRAPAQAASNMSSQLDRAGTYVWTISQSHRVTRVCVNKSRHYINCQANIY